MSQLLHCHNGRSATAYVTGDWSEYRVWEICKQKNQSFKNVQMKSSHYARTHIRLYLSHVRTKPTFSYSTIYCHMFYSKRDVNVPKKKQNQFISLSSSCCDLYYLEQIWYASLQFYSTTSVIILLCASIWLEF